MSLLAERERIRERFLPGRVPRAKETSIRWRRSTGCQCVGARLLNKAAGLRGIGFDPERESNRSNLQTDLARKPLARWGQGREPTRNQPAQQRGRVGLSPLPRMAACTNLW